MKKKALIIVDVQNTFCPNGKLAVPQGDEVVDPINFLMDHGNYDVIVATQDWHPKNHISFAPNAKVDVFTQFTTPAGRKQMAWPIHAEAGTEDAALHPRLKTEKIAAIIRKGMHPAFDSYSGFQDDGGAETGLDAFLQAHHITDIDVVGLATEYCVAFTAIHGREKGYATKVLLGACKGLNQDEIKRVYTEHKIQTT